MRLDSRLGDEELLGDLAVGPATAEQLENLLLAGGETEITAVRRTVPTAQKVVVDEAIRWPWGDHAVTAVCPSDGLDQVLRAGVLQEEACCAGVERLQEELVLVKGGEQDDPQLGVLPAQLDGGLDTRHRRHLDVHD